MPYLPMDPADVGVGDSNIIGISSQSGKSGILWLLEHTIELQPPKELAIVFCQTIKRLSMEQKREIAADEICNLFLDTYHLAGLDDRGKAKLFHARDHRAISIDIKDIHREINNKLGEAGEEVIVREILAEMSHVLSISLSCSQHSSHPTDQRAETAAYVRCAIDDSTESWGVGLGPDISAAYVSAVLSSLMVGVFHVRPPSSITA